eukprot:TRINITY_DN77515_c0_g1_i1.p1 TRINITY_DN77515_c0_g1~~TRINITY_DN77515_c0_g1_i1.p1  ORF type:complete len:195 (+),score=17.77 TRINITY_DN77515_c0_g1_i1:85-585(+)
MDTCANLLCSSPMFFRAQGLRCIRTIPIILTTTCTIMLQLSCTIIHILSHTTKYQWSKVAAITTSITIARPTITSIIIWLLLVLRVESTLAISSTTPPQRSSHISNVKNATKSSAQKVFGSVNTTSGIAPGNCTVMNASKTGQFASGVALLIVTGLASPITETGNG